MQRRYAGMRVAPGCIATGCKGVVTSTDRSHTCRAQEAWAVSAEGSRHSPTPTRCAWWVRLYRRV